MQVEAQPASVAPQGEAGAWTTLRRWREAHPILSLYVLAASTRVLAFVALTLGGLLIPEFNGWEIPQWRAKGPEWLVRLARWDSGFYLQIAHEGRVDHRPELWAFSPGYPLAVRAVHDAFPPLGEVGAASLVGLAAFAAAIPLAYHLGARWFDRATAWRGAALLALMPGSFYFMAAYADGLFVALMLGCFLALGHRRWILAGALASLAGVARPQGLFLPGVVLLAALLDRARAGRWSAAALAAVPLAAALPVFDMWLAWEAKGDPLFAHHVRSATWPQVSWHNPWFTFWWDLPPLQGILVRASLLLLLAGMAWSARDAWRRRLAAPLEIHAWTLGLGVLCLTYSDPTATLRYLLPILGVTWMLAAWARTPRRFALVALVNLAALLAVAALFAAWFPFY